MNRAVVFIPVMLVCISGLLGQKVKYKDLFPLLEAKNYAEGGPLLFKYLSDPKNQEEANPMLQMGIMLEDQFLGYDILTDSSRIYSSGDSAVSFLQTAKSLIDEKELKKRDQYYQSFFRRDLRTGEFGIKVSDVHLDIEKKIEDINQRIADVKSFHGALNRVENNHNEARKQYAELAKEFSTYNEFLLANGEEEVEVLQTIQTLGENVIKDATKVSNMAKALGSDKYQSDVALKEITEFGTDGLEVEDLKTGSITIWDYETWARNTLSEIRGSVGLFKTLVLNYVEELRRKKAIIKKSKKVDGLAVTEELIETFEKYDPESAVLSLLKLETFECRIMQQVDLQINPDLMDSAKVGSQLAIYKEAKLNADSMYALVNTINTVGLGNAKRRFPKYMDTFFKSYMSASKYVEDMKSWSSRNKEWLTNSVNYWKERNKWGIIVKEGAPEKKVPLFASDTIYSGIKTFRVNKFTQPQVVVYGMDTTTNKGYLGSFGEDRVQQWTLDFDLPLSDSLSITENLNLIITDTIPSGNSATSFYVFNALSKENNLSAVSYTDEGAKEWSVTVSVPKKPVDFKFDELTQELTILLYPEEELPLDTDELGYLVIDRTGNVR